MGKYCIMPALSLQYITTREPRPDQIEVALAALDLALHPETAPENTQSEAVVGADKNLASNRQAVGKQ